MYFVDLSVLSSECRSLRAASQTSKMPRLAKRPSSKIRLLALARLYFHVCFAKTKSNIVVLYQRNRDTHHPSVGFGFPNGKIVMSEPCYFLHQVPVPNTKNGSTICTDPSQGFKDRD